MSAQRSSIFPPVVTKQNAWSRAPKFTILPDRFVFIGYDGAEATKIEIGQPVPSPLMPAPIRLRHRKSNSSMMSMAICLCPTSLNGSPISTLP